MNPCKLRCRHTRLDMYEPECGGCIKTCTCIAAARQVNQARNERIYALMSEWLTEWATD